MKNIQVELLSDSINAVILKTPGRNYPGMVIQGDNLKHLYNLAEKILQLAEAGAKHEDIEDISGMLFDDLNERIRFYEMVLDSYGLELPYPNRVSEMGA
ncbi:DUF6959 family protein [Gimesia fumaroli]|uniref:Uncharacterized protein n=1 Tax=Gimesia fumaroli TaxID=2527976 RepID=A0A518IE27_9PLAN|nr:hypothetical protein [Gimesia fumaroli]QDV51346.1 hypothetical protein Enr17x_34020 [Gimesia fumaroli]